MSQNFLNIQPSIQRMIRASVPLIFGSCAALIGLTIAELPASRVWAQTAVTQDLQAAGLFQQGVMRYNDGDLQAAELALRAALSRDSNLASARNYLGNIFLQQNRLDAAVQEYGEAIRLNPNLAEAYYNLGLALHKQGQNEAAITAYRQALVVEPTMANANYNLGLALYQQGQTEEAIAAYQQSINLDRNNANAYFNLGLALQEQGDAAKAIIAYREVLQLSPNNAAAYNNLGNLLVARGQTPEAIETYIQAIRKVPNNPSAYYKLGVAFYKQGEYKKAQQVLRRAHKQYRKQGNVEQTEVIEELMQEIISSKNKKQPEAETSVETSPESEVVIPDNNETEETSDNREFEFSPDSAPETEETPTITEDSFN
ncbi:Flp pilus assembly protein TadD [Rivularia sp. PCC 7116]|uniref:tetratricopeptide repeat protein n=1 Tax=Rivularia sp. PCC 7116 TaxID=373994 RepID=UPI00029F0325|nr:Flp pilus assembly protein TadD [Rivularia sp. PCC 7116]